jgi:hypothetical protein
MSDWETEERRPRLIGHRTQVDAPDTWTRSSAWPPRSAMSVYRQQHEARHGPWSQSHSRPIQERRSATSTPNAVSPWPQNHQPTRQRVYPLMRQCWSEVDSQPTPSRQGSRHQTTTPWPRREPHVVQAATSSHRASLDDSSDAYHTGAFDDESWPRSHPRPCHVDTSWAYNRQLDIESTPAHVQQPANSFEDTLAGHRIEQQPFSLTRRERQRHWSDRSSRRLSDVSEHDASGKHVRQVRPPAGRAWHLTEVVPTHQPQIASRRGGDWLRNDVQQGSSSSSSAPARVFESVQDSFVNRERAYALANRPDDSTALIHRDNESDTAHHAAGIKVEGQDAQVLVQAVTQRSSALGKRRVRARSSSLVDETLVVGVKRSREVVHNNVRINIVGQRNDSVVSHTVKPKRYRKPCEIDGCTSIAQSKGLCRTHGGGKRCQYPEGCRKGAIGATLFCVAHGGGKRCQYPGGCDKSAQGATSFCIAHGGVQRCQYPDGCDKSVQRATLFCVAHGGGKRCQFPDGCDKGAQGATLFCQAHGGGKRCQYPEGCRKGAEGRTFFCIAHGGGKRCQYPEGCDKSAQGATFFCNGHGGGKRCQFPDGCDKGAPGATLFCQAHGGGKRCQYPEGCSKGAEGRTFFCIAHGGGKRCQYPDGCDKSARGATLFCRAHGGGKRCQFPYGCDKSAIGATLFCQAHGGGKRCQFPEGCDKGARGATLFCIAHGGGK